MHVCNDGPFFNQKTLIYWSVFASGVTFYWQSLSRSRPRTCVEIYSVALSIFPLRLLSSPSVQLPEACFLLFRISATPSQPLLWERIEADALLVRKHVLIGPMRFPYILLDYLLPVREVANEDDISFLSYFYLSVVSLKWRSNKEQNEYGVIMR